MISDKKYEEKFLKSTKGTLFDKLSLNDREFIRKKARFYGFSHQQIKQIIDIAVDLSMWSKGDISFFWNDFSLDTTNKKAAGKKALISLKKRYDSFKEELNDYEEIESQKIKAPKIKLLSMPKENLGFGLCPVASPKTRCCNLLTLDAVESCGFDCSYCSIQSFYNEGKVVFDTDLKKKLENISLDPNEFYHIGTGQSSDSLMWGNRYGVLDNLLDFAKKNRNVLLEFKTKSDNVSYFLDRKLPKNLLFTWSLNPQTIIDKEEHLSASLEDRINAARKMINKGALVGFHFHPIVYYKNYQKEYKEVFDKLLNSFDPKYVVMVSFGTLTFTKPVIKKIRSREFKTKILQMPFSEAANKFSYPFHIKKEMFKFAYDSFKSWHKKVFFYLCMEDHSLWREVFGYDYPTNESFEMDMKLNYKAKIEGLSSYQRTNKYS